MKTIINQYIDAKLRREHFYSDLAIVKSVDDTTRKATIEIVNSELEITARTQAQINLTGGLYIKPSVDSYVIVNWVNKLLCFISCYSEIDSITYQNGENLGIPKTPETVAQLNKLEQDINDLKQIFSTTWIPVPTDGGAALKAAAATWAGSVLTETVNDDIQNENFKQ